jgi:hypothetical protein
LKLGSKPPDTAPEPEFGLYLHSEYIRRFPLERHIYSKVIHSQPTILLAALGLRRCHIPKIDRSPLSQLAAMSSTDLNIRSNEGLTVTDELKEALQQPYYISLSKGSFKSTTEPMSSSHVHVPVAVQLVLLS